MKIRPEYIPIVGFVYAFWLHTTTFNKWRSEKHWSVKADLHKKLNDAFKLYHIGLASMLIPIFVAWIIITVIYKM